ncbi:MAG: hypothetical protein DI537_23850 [Stutzerimonas stutzeri]|nr:MAG: hypothetical protein DI537_23850 [Stutzerimonas stutzeri]
MNKHFLSARTRASQIAALASDGMSSREIAAVMSISGARVRLIAQRYSIPLARPGSRRFGLYVSDTRARLIRELAEEAGVSPATMIERMCRVVLDDGIDRARRQLGKLAIAPVRQG